MLQVLRGADTGWTYRCCPLSRARAGVLVPEHDAWSLELHTLVNQRVTDKFTLSTVRSKEARNKTCSKCCRCVIEWIHEGMAW
jgi:hypothetical protein